MTLEAMRTKKLFCPLCGVEMLADLHEPMEGWQEIDNWVCMNDGGGCGKVCMDRRNLYDILLEQVTR